MKKDVLEKAIDIISKIENLEREEYFFILASFIMYFNQPLSKKSWNTFPKRVENNTITLGEAIFSTDEEKNPDVFLKQKDNKLIKEELFKILVNTKNKLKSKINFLDNSILIIPDMIKIDDFTVFPKIYLKKLIDEGNYNNELTGQPLSWNVVDSIKNNKTLHKISGKKITNENLIKYINSELDKIQRIANRCIVCKCSTTKYKSILEHSCIYFCSLNCMKKLDI